MKKLNNKGFTLIELLAVIVILSILVAIAVPSVTRYLNGARKSAFADSAKGAIMAVRYDVFQKGVSTETFYSYSEINELLDTKLDKSPYGTAYSNTSYIKVSFDANDNAVYSICLTDGANGFPLTEEKNLDENALKIGTTVTCTR